MEKTAIRTHKRSGGMTAYDFGLLGQFWARLEFEEQARVRQLMRAGLVELRGGVVFECEVRS